jgi:hypothetical protein
MNTALRRRAGIFRSLGAAFLTLAVLMGAMDWHAAGEAHSFGEAAAAAGTSFSPAAVHPGQPLHLESSAVAKRPVCPFCLLRLQTAGGHLLAAVPWAPLALSGALPTGPVSAAPDASHTPREARGPPFA